jgi:hypothetical protein
MKRIGCVLLAGMLLAGGNAFAGELAQEIAPGDVIVEAQWTTAMSAAQRGDAEVVLLSLRPAMADDVWSQLSARRKYEVAELYGQAASGLARWADANRGFQRASELPQGSLDDWNERLHSANSAGLGADAWLAFDHLQKLRAPMLAGFGGREVIRLDALFSVLPNAREARLALGRQLEAEQRSPLQEYNDESIVWAHYAEALLEGGQNAHAAAAAARITDPIVITELLADRRFDAIVAGNPKLADPRAAAERYLAWAQANAEAKPHSLAAGLAVVRALALLDRPQEALAAVGVIDKAMARGSADEPWFEDQPFELTVYQAWKGSLLLRAGRAKDAVTALNIVEPCQCMSKVPLDLARTLLETGQTREATTWIKAVEVESLTVEDQLTFAETRVCVAADLNDAAAVDEGLAFLRAHRAGRPRSLVAALVCANRLDQAAEELVAQFADPHLRLAALGAAQVYADPVGLPYSTEQRERWAKVLARPEVRQAVGAVGRSATFALEAREAHA